LAESDRKEEHLDIVATRDVRSAHATGLERYALVHCALPEIQLSDVDMTTTFLGHRLGAPLLISAMTGGTPRAREINERLAKAAQRCGVALNLGSLRVALEQPGLMETYRVRAQAPDILLMANIGAVQLNYGVTAGTCIQAVQELEADALVLHLNPLQEAIQPGGDTDFRGLLSKIAALCEQAPFPVLVKEVGWGISSPIARSLAQAGVAAIDVAGSGGTSWSRVEAHRLHSTAERQVAAAFDDWGIPTATALLQVREACPDLPLIASGGIETGVDIAKCLALGANLAGIARPLLKAAIQSAEASLQHVQAVLRQLQIALFCTGVDRVGALGREHIFLREP